MAINLKHWQVAFKIGVFRGLHGLVHAEVEKLTAQREHHAVLAANTLLDREMFRFALFQGICNGNNT